MRILHLIAGAAHGGAETFAIDTILALHERKVGGGVEQFVLCRGHDIFLRPLRAAGIPFKIQAFMRWKKWYEQRVIRQQVASYNPDLIHCWMTRAAEFTPKGTGVPVLGRSGATIKMKYSKACDYYMGVSHEICERAKRESGHPDRVFLGHNFGTLPQDPPLSREEFGIPEDKPIILMLARMHSDKGVDILLRACVDLDAFLLLAGDGPELENYKNLARDLELDRRVCFTGWRNDRAALLDLADILAVPSRREGSPRVMPQAWFKGVPVVGSNASGLGEYIVHGENGMSSEIEDVRGLAKNLEAVIADKQLREKLIAGGRHTHDTQFSKEVVISKLLETYKEIIRRGVVS